MDRSNRLAAGFLALFLCAVVCVGYTGTGGVWALKAGDFVAKNFPGTQTGIDAAVTYCGSSGYVQIGPGLGSLSPTTIPNGVSVIRNDSTGWTIVGGALYLANAYKGKNGNTNPVLYSDKTLDLTTTINNQADKSVDVVTTYTGTTASTNLSLNGAHFINRYGVSGVGGGDVATGMGVGAYSEHRGNYAITGSLYGAENATTMYNGGSLAFGFGSLNTTQITSGANANITNAYGARGIARNFGGTGNITSAIGISGIAGTEASASGTITDAIGGRFETEKSGGTVTNATGVVVPAITQGSTNNFGVRVAGAASGGSGINQSLRVDAGDSYFGGKVYPDSGLWAGSVSGNIWFYGTNGTRYAYLGGTTGEWAITNGGYYSLSGYKLLEKSVNTVRMLASTSSDSTKEAIAFRDSSNAVNLLTIRSGGAMVMRAYTFNGKPSAPTAGMMIFCSDCTRPSDPATGGGTGGMAIYANNRWYVP